MLSSLHMKWELEKILYPLSSAYWVSMYVPREFFAVPEWLPVHARGVPRHSRNSSQCQGRSWWMQSKLTWCCRCRNACQKRDILAGGINNMYQRGNINTLRKGWKWIQRVTAYARGVTWHMVELKEPRNKHVAGRMLSCFIHTVGMRSQLPVPGRGEPVLMFQEPRATEILPYTWVLLLPRELALKIPLLSLGPLPCTREGQVPVQRGSTVPRTNYGGSQEIQGVMMPKGVRPQEYASQSSLPQTIICFQLFPFT